MNPTKAKNKPKIQNPKSLIQNSSNKMSTNTIKDHKAIRNTLGTRGTHKMQMQEEGMTDMGKQTGSD